MPRETDAAIVVVGTGKMGADHVRRINSQIGGAYVAAVVDTDISRAQDVAATAAGAGAFGSLDHAFAETRVDGVLIATPGPSHESILLDTLPRRVPILCEKPLTPDVPSSLRVLDAEIAGGQRLIQVGFMRRYDREYAATKDLLAGGTVGAGLLGGFVHRLGTNPPGLKESEIISEAVVHEFDIIRWLFDDEIASVHVKKPRPSSLSDPALSDPQIVIVETVGGVVVTVEANMGAQYGYEVSGYVVAERATIEFGRPSGVAVRHSGMLATAVTDDFRPRFRDAYDTEVQHWIDSIHKGVTSGPSAWDGYAAAAACEAGIRSQSGGLAEVTLIDKPEFYAATDPRMDMSLSASSRSA